MKYIQWNDIRNLLKCKYFKLSYIILFLVPILSRLSYAYDDSDNIIKTFMQLLDYDVLKIPNNILRIYWSSILIIISNIFYEIFCPIIIKKYNNYPDWCKSEEYNCNVIQLRKKFGSKIDINHTLNEIYTKKYNENLNKYVIIRLFIVMLIITIAYLLLRVFLDQIAIVFKVTELKVILY